MQPWLKRLFQIEKSTLPLIYFIGAFVALVLIRLFWDQLQSDFPLGNEWMLNQFLWAAVVYLSLVSVFCLVTGTPILEKLRIGAYLVVFLLLGPLLELIPGLGTSAIYTGSALDYPIWERILLDNSPGELLSFAIFAFVLLAYVAVQPIKTWKKILLPVLMIGIVGLGVYVPVLIPKLYAWMGGGPIAEPFTLLNKYYLLILLLSLVLVFYLASPQRFEIMLADFRFVWIIHSLIWMAVGIFLFIRVSYNPAPLLSRPDLLPDFLLIFIGMSYAGVFVISLNNVADRERDREVFPDRPYAAGFIAKDEYLRIGAIMLACASLAVLLVSFISLLILLVSCGCWFLYSSPPFRLKKYLLLPKFLLGLQALSLAYLGFSLGGKLEVSFPGHFAPFILFSVAMALHFRDLEHPEADARHGIQSLPVWLGLSAAKGLIALLVAGHYSWMYLLSRGGEESFALIILGVLQVLLLFLRPFNIRRSFFVYLAGLAVFATQILSNGLSI